MRLTDIEIEAIKNAVIERDANAEVYLFGSRIDDNAKGGDIDILVISKDLKLDDKLFIKARIFETIEEQKLDIVISNDVEEPFVKLAIERGVRL